MLESISQKGATEIVVMFITQSIQKKALDRLFLLAGDQPFAVNYWDKTTRNYGSGGSPVFTLSLRNPTVFRRLMDNMEIGFGEAYMDGHIDLEGDLADFAGWPGEARLRLRLRRSGGFAGRQL